MNNVNIVMGPVMEGEQSGGAWFKHRFIWGLPYQYQNVYG